MDKTKLLMMIATQAPQVLSALKNSSAGFSLDSDDASINPLFAIGEGLRRGYDMDALAHELNTDNDSNMLIHMMPDSGAHGLGIVDYSGNPSFKPMAGPSPMWESLSKNDVDPYDFYNYMRNAFKK